MASRPRRSAASKYKTKSPKTPNGMVNGLKSSLIESETATEIRKICEDNFKIPKELDINSNRRMCNNDGSGDSPVSNEQPMIEEEEKVRSKKRKIDKDSDLSATPSSSKVSYKKRISSSPMDGLCEQLVQALQSNDQDLLDNVLKDRTPEEMTTTTNNIPGEYIQSLLEHLRRRVHTRSTENICHLIWLEKLLQTRISLLISLPSTKIELTSLMEALNVRTELLQKVIALRGMMNLVMSQASNKPISSSMRDRKALREFEDSSDEESDDEEEIMYEEHGEESNSEGDQSENHEETDDDSSGEEQVD